MTAPALLFSRLRLPGALVACLAAFGAAAHAADGELVRGSGKVAAENRSVAPFRAIHVTGSMQLVLHQGGKETLEVRADDNLLPLIETAVVDSAGIPTLQIGSKMGTSFT